MVATVAVFCGGFSKERGISLNSTRCFLDHASALGVHLIFIYVSPQGHYCQLDPSHLYSNTPADFDFKLSSIGTLLTQETLLDLLRQVDLVFPLIHGIFGEDGTLQQWLESRGLPFVGSTSKVCETAFNKILARKKLESLGFQVLPWMDMQGDYDPDWDRFCKAGAIVKPAKSGSSIGVAKVHSGVEARHVLARLRREGFSQCMIEPYCSAREFTVCVLQNKEGRPVSLMPLEISLDEGILDYRKKYLPTPGTRYYCPPRFSLETILRIRSEAERLFEGFGLCDFARIDGFLQSDGSILFSDLNPISGMEQNSFLFQQAARIGMSHADLISYILERSLARYDKARSLRSHRAVSKKMPIYVVTGGDTSERQVALMSGTNVWLKLQTAGRNASLFLLEKERSLWEIPYAYSLHHTVEETLEHCRSERAETPGIEPLVHSIRKELSLEPLAHIPRPRLLTLGALLKRAKQANAFVFLGLHGGEGEDGTIQQMLEEAEIPFNGSGSLASKICMDKHKTARCIEELQDPMVLPMPQISFAPGARTPEELWKEASLRFGAQDILIKPQCDGCSTGVVRIVSLQDLKRYLGALAKQESHLPPNTLTGQHTQVELPLKPARYLLEPFIATDRIRIAGASLKREEVSGWCEMTIGVLERRGKYTALHPSITVAEHCVLSVEEKFQGGTGINITPPPEEILSASSRQRVMEGAARAATALGIQNYARLDLFVECTSGRVRVIEANTLPALTPSTVFYHQALSVTPPLPPKELLLALIENARSRFV